MAKILIVEDDPFLRKMYVKKLQIEGFDVDIATDGAEGLAKLKSFAPDLALLDVMLPKLNGLEVIDRAKADPQTKNIPILVFSNLSSAADEETAKKKGAVGFIVKSDVTPAQVVEKVKQYLK